MAKAPAPRRGDVWLVDFQVKSLSLSRFSRRIGAVTASKIGGIADAVALCVGAP
jgi:mRNA-degrading endonuclease toxin of MazEF toxin-antitoxin module